MSGVRRRERAGARLEAIEAEYRTSLVAALGRCAAGTWGLFGQNEHLRGVRVSVDAAAILELGAAIDAQRAALGLDPAPLHARFMALRGRQGQDQSGEPKLAAALLADIERGVV